MKPCFHTFVYDRAAGGPRCVNCKVLVRRDAAPRAVTAPGDATLVVAAEPIAAGALVALDTSSEPSFEAWARQVMNMETEAEKTQENLQPISADTAEFIQVGRWVALGILALVGLGLGAIVWGLITGSF